MFEDEREVTYNPNEGTWKIRRGNIEQTYRDLVMAFVFGDAAAQDRDLRLHAISVAGRREDNIVVQLLLLWDFWDNAVELARDLKDKWWIARCIVPELPESLLDDLREVEGFTHYARLPSKDSNILRYENPPDTWPFFRSYEHRVSLSLVDPELENDIPSAIVRLDRLMGSGKVTISRDSQYAGLRDSFGRDVHESQHDPRLKAVIYSVEAVRPAKKQLRKSNKPKSWY